MNSFKFKYPNLLLATSIALSANAIANEATQSTKEEMEVITVSPKGLISYVSASASKSDTPIVKSPVSVSVLTEKRIADLGAETLQDAIGYVAGVYNGPYGVDTRGDWAHIRGVAPVQYLDGLQMMFGYYNNARPNPYNFERIEILKGPSSMLYGQGSTGGIINSVSKRPKQGTSGEIWAQLGNFYRKQLAFDFNTAADSNEDVLVRTVAMYRDSETQTEYVDDNTLFFAPSLTWHVTDNTSLTVLTNFQKNESGSSTQFFPHEGTINSAQYGQISSERFVSEPGWDQYDTEQKAVTLIVDHYINDMFSVHWSARKMDSEATYRTMYAWPPKLQEDKRSIVRNFSLSDAVADSITTDLQLRGAFDTGMVSHTIVTGIDYQSADTDTDRLYLTPASIKQFVGIDVDTSLDLYDPVYGQIGFLPTGDMIPDTPGQNDKQIGIYFQDSMEIGNFIVNAALRYDEVETKSDAAGAVKDEQSATTGRLGILYTFEDYGIAPYVSYSESFLPQYGARPDGLDENGQVKYGTYKPREGEQLEAGIKYQPKGTEHLITASVFDITQKNAPRSIAPNHEVQDGSTNIQGIELEAQLEFNEFDVYAAYAYTDSEQNTSDKSKEELLGLILQGQTYLQNQLITDSASLAAVPEHLFNIWTTYRPESFLPGLKVGAGMRYVGETFDGSRTIEALGQTLHTAVTTDAYTVFDLMVGYEFNNFDISLNVDNVADKTVVTSCLYRGDCFYGQQRTITANVKYRF